MIHPFFLACVVVFYRRKIKKKKEKFSFPLLSGDPTLCVLRGKMATAREGRGGGGRGDREQGEREGRGSRRGTPGNKKGRRSGEGEGLRTEGYPSRDEGKGFTCLSSQKKRGRQMLRGRRVLLGAKARRTPWEGFSSSSLHLYDDVIRSSLPRCFTFCTTQASTIDAGVSNQMAIVVNTADRKLPNKKKKRRFGFWASKENRRQFLITLSPTLGVQKVKLFRIFCLLVLVFWFIISVLACFISIIIVFHCCLFHI